MVVNNCFFFYYYISIVDVVDSQDVATPKEKGKSSTQKRKRGPTEMKEITCARSEGQKTKEVVNLIVTTQKTTNAFGEEDILTRALGGKDRHGILQGVGEYVTKKKFVKVNIAKDDEEVEGVTLEKMKDRTPCKLAFEMKDHVVAWGTIIDSDVEGDNVKVAVDVVVDGDCAIIIPSEQRMYKMSQEVGLHILWPRDLDITDNIKMDYGEFTKDMITFAPTPI
ncbi:uncharacterized protein E5676_scaffold94G00600 [Cucumis melo var. makuwa]|uniref:Uncharacterized protein n=1 Tax=Cucumis melo var. makuwa TaxID=1194695 RepID=A0A5A7U7K8_CUCMM|nr:uncharacterized protein E6C27_scaffold163G00300 [Cucumis melo var. makuwa]TYK15945.1 uncharacterized protein E5676_scaffold94G00600 [Cucumis melo var. makuwa]